MLRWTTLWIPFRLTIMWYRMWIFALVLICWSTTLTHIITGRSLRNWILWSWVQWYVMNCPSLYSRSARTEPSSDSLTHTCKQAWPAAHEVVGSSSPPSSCDARAGIGPYPRASLRDLLVSPTTLYNLVSNLSLALPQEYH